MESALFETETDTQTVRGTINRIMYAENGRCIARITVAPESLKGPDGKRRPSFMSILGSMADPKVGQMYELAGRVTFNERFSSHQIEFDSYRTILPTDNAGIMSYLIDVARWVGPSIAKALVDELGSETLRVLREDPDRVRQLNIPGLTPERIDEMRETLCNNEKLEAATVEVNNLLGGVLGPATVRKAIKKWGCDAATLIKADPYSLTALPGVGFVSADAVGKKIGFDAADLKRHRAAVLHVLGEAASREGHTVVSMNRVQMEAAKLVGPLRPEVFEDCIKVGAITCNGVSVTLAELCDSERYIAGKIASMMTMIPRGDEEGRPGGNHFAFETIDKSGLAEDQAAAVAAFERAPVFVLCGAPGTGKTYTVARIVRGLLATGLTIELAAPTGKAAKQMSLALADTVGGHARTIHSLLEPTINEDTGEFRFERGEGNPLDCDVLIVDEFSMVDVPLCRSLLKAVRETTRILIVGDHYQLPSVGPGAVLRDLLAAGVPSFELKKIKRNAGLIVRACHAMKDGRQPRPAEHLDLETGANWRHIEVGDAAQIKEVIETLIRDKLPAAGVDPQWGWQIISPTNERGELSCDALNGLAKAIVNPTRPVEKGLRFAVGDKVVRTKNGQCKGDLLKDVAAVRVTRDAEEEAEEYRVRGSSGQIRIVNGDIGLVREITKKEITVQFRFPDRLAVIKRADHHLRQAYCMTCHKMQGSEVDVVILPLHRSIAGLPMVTREWIYTAFSRAKRFIVTVGDIDAIGPMVGKVGTHARGTLLKGMLEELKPAEEFEL